jgi:two-component system response regulator
MAAPVLIAEDNEHDLFLLTKALERARVTNPIHSVRTGAELTQYLMGIGSYRDRNLHPLPGLILLDLKLRDMQGTDVLRFLNGRKDLSNITVVVWTASMGPADVRELEELRIRCRVPKPNSPEVLHETVRGLNDFLVVEGHQPVLEFP